MMLRPIEPGDAGLLFELDSDPEVMRYLSGGPGTPLSQIESEILPRILAYPGKAPWAAVWIACDAASGEFVGWFSLRPSEDVFDGPDLGYRLARRWWGSGLATEGAAAIIAHAFSEGAVRRVFATTYEFNTRSRRVLEKLGMRHVRSFRFEEEATPETATYASGQSVAWDGDEVEYAITREEWLERRFPG
jgi:RimJ/RimL family protein N-acetyltransferase